MMARCSKSRSLTRNRSASINRSPEPYMRHAANQCDPSRCRNSALTSLTCRTTGNRCGRRARTTLPTSPSGRSSTALVEEHERVQRLILRTCRHLPVDGEMREKLPDLRFAQLAGVALPVEQNEAAHPEEIALLRTDAVMPHPNGMPSPPIDPSPLQDHTLR
jgi:hypothetical protein